MVRIDGDNEQSVTVPLGEPIEVQFEENGSTGYAWKLQVPRDWAVDNDFEPGGDAPGHAGRRLFRIYPTSRGAFKIAAELRRAYGGKPTDARHFVIKVQ